MARGSFKKRADVESVLKVKYERNRLRWVREAALKIPFEPIEIALGIPTTEQAASDVKRLEDWIRHWKSVEQEGFELLWRDAHWPSLGKVKKIPERIRFSCIDSVLDFIARSAAPGKSFSRALQRANDILKADCDVFDPALKKKSLLFEFSQEDFERLFLLFHWLSDHRPVNLFIRQLPVEGVDTKWFERHRGLLGELLRARFPDLDWEQGGIEKLWALKSPERMVIVKGLEQFIAAIGSPSYLALTASVLNTIEPKAVVIFENLQTALSVKPLPGVLILMGMGMACEILDEITWMKKIPIFYFGDLDGHGLAILGRVRSHFPQVQSVLMNRQTLQRWKHLAVKDPNSRFPDPIGLTQSEKELFELLVVRRLRLEQERIPISEVNAELKKQLGV